MVKLWKKITRAVGQKKGTSSRSQSSSSQKPKPKQTLQSSPRPQSSSTQQTRPPRTLSPQAPSKNKKKEAAARITPTRSKSKSTDNKSKNRTSATKMSMMSPDMLETLGLTEFGVDIQKQGHANNTTSTASQPSRRSRDGTRTSTRERQQQQNSKMTSDDTTASSSYIYNFGDDDTTTKASSSATSSSSSGSSFEDPMPRDPFCDSSQSNCFWNFAAEDDEDDIDAENNASCTQQLYRDSANLDPMTCVGIVLAMPVACGMVCIDNVLDTTLFDSATKKYYSTPGPSNEQYKDPKRSSRKERWKSQLQRENRVSQ